LDAHLI